MAMGVNDIVVSVFADMRQFEAGMGKATSSIRAFAGEADTVGGRVATMGTKIANAIAVGVGGALVYGVREAYKYNEALDAIANQSGASASEIDYLKGKIFDVSNATGFSATTLADAALQIEKAGIRGAAAYGMLNDAAEAARITGGQVTDVVQTIVSAQTLQIAKGESVAQITATLVAANRLHLGSMDSLVSMLQGPVASRLAEYGVNLQEATSFLDIGSKAGLTNARSLNAMLTALGKLENPTKSQNALLEKYGLSAQLLTNIMKQPDGLIQVMERLRTVAAQTGTPVSALANAVFGSGGGGAAASAFINNAGALVNVYKQLAGANPATLQAQFQDTMKQLGPQLDKAGANLNNALLNVGEAILPDVAKVTGWVATFASALNSNQTLRDVLGGGALLIAGGVVANKIYSAFQAVKSIFTGTEQAAQTTLLQAIADNTAALVAEGGGGGGGVTAAEALAGAGAGDLIAGALGMAAFVIGTKHIVDTTSSALSNMSLNLPSMSLGGGGNLSAADIKANNTPTTLADIQATLPKGYSITPKAGLTWDQYAVPTFSGYQGAYVTPKQAQTDLATYLQNNPPTTNTVTVKVK